jgi:membrane protease YdiL (CAAX protease family)
VLRRLTSGAPDARVGIYRGAIAQQWIAVVFIVGIGALTHRPLAAYALAVPQGAGVIVSAVAGLIIATLLWLQWSSVARLSPERHAAVRARFAKLDSVAPHTSEERRWFWPLSVTAGVCEELIYRGFLIWALQPWLGTWGAAAVSLVSFTAGHSYQGRKQIPSVAMMGAFLTLLAVLTGSVLPGMVLHALVDIGGGETMYMIFGPPPRKPEPQAV